MEKDLEQSEIETALDNPDIQVADSNNSNNEKVLITDNSNRTNVMPQVTDACKRTEKPAPMQSKQDSKHEAILGKFASVDALVNAYEELTRAFTKKSQELARVTNKCKSADAEVYSAGDCKSSESEENGSVHDVACSTHSAADNKGQDKPRPEEIIKNYLLSVASGKIAPTVITGSDNGFAFSNVESAKSIHATTKVAENFFKEKKL